MDPGHLSRAFGIDPDQPGVGVRRPQHGRMEQAGNADVLHEPAGPGHETVSPQAEMRLTDHRRIICWSGPGDR